MFSPIPNIQGKLRRIIMEITGMSKEEFSQGPSLEYDLGINSFWRRARLIRAIRKNFGMGNLKVTHREIKESKTLWELSKLIYRKLPTLVDEKEYVLSRSN